MKVYVGKVPMEKMVDAERLIVHAGLRALEGVEKVRSEEEADLIIYSQRYADHHCGIAFWQEKYAANRKFLSPLQIKYPEKTIILDFADDPTTLIPLSQPVKAYYKRSLVDKKYADPVFKFSGEDLKLLCYSIRSDFLPHVETDKDYSERKTHVSCFFPFKKVNGVAVGKSDWHGAVCRAKVTEEVLKFKEACEIAELDYNVHVGVVGKKGGVGRSTIQNAYFDKCKDSKIIVHCQPFGWEGDFRTFEALASGALVISDKSYSMQHHTYPLIDGVHLVEYDRNDLTTLINKIVYYIKNPSEAEKIARAGQEYALKHHTHTARMKQILNLE
jgi:hypothetical protein